MSWLDAQRYVTWLSAKTGKTYRLLSEAEREYAARAGTTTPFWWGKTISPRRANYDATVVYGGGGKKGAAPNRTEPVNAFAPHPWGLHQVHGNVWEWVQDVWHEDYQGAPDDGSAWEGENEQYRVARGAASSPNRER